MGKTKAKTRDGIIGERIAAKRRSMPLTQSQLAARADTDQSTVSDIERGRVRLGRHLGERIATALGWSLREIYTGTKWED